MEHRNDLPAAQAAAAVKREVPDVDKDGKPTGKTKEVAVKAGEVLANAVREDGTLTVVTADGQKLVGVAPKAAAK